jgi:hypothetical protein
VVIVVAVAVGIRRAEVVIPAVAATPVVIARHENVEYNASRERVAVNEVKVRGEKGVPNGTPFLLCVRVYQGLS